MSGEIARVVRVRRGPSTPDGVFSDLETDNGYRCVVVEKPDVPGNQPDADCIPDGRYLGRWRWSPKHAANLYHVDDVPGRSDVEIHAANVHEQLLGCLAPGLMIVVFHAGTLHGGLPTRDMRGVTSSGAALADFHKAMRGPDGEQQPFWLEVSWA